MTNKLTFNFKYKEAYTSTIEFDMQINEKHKGKEQRYPKWTYPKRTFTLKFDKNFTDRQALENFFIEVMQSGGKFYWKWEKEKGGNDKTYHVRFDSDTLQMDIDRLGYATLQIQLKEVFPTANPLLEVEKDEIIPRKLLNIDIPDGGIRIIDNETLAELTYNGNQYLGAPLSHGDITRDDNSSVSKLNIYKFYTNG